MVECTDTQHALQMEIVRLDNKVSVLANKIDMMDFHNKFEEQHEKKSTLFTPPILK